jgi:hypothetical protein
VVQSLVPLPARCIHGISPTNSAGDPIFFENVALWSKGNTYRGFSYPIVMAVDS